MTAEEFNRLLEQAKNSLRISVKDLRDNKPKKRMRPREEEHKLQVQCITWFRTTYPDVACNIFAVPNGGRRDKVTAGKLKAEGVLAGVADIILLIPNAKFHALCIEMKTQKGRQSDSQKAWQKMITKFGYDYQVVRSLSEFQETIHNYFNQKQV